MGENSSVTSRRRRKRRHRRAVIIRSPGHVRKRLRFWFIGTIIGSLIVYVVTQFV
jgi:hypothetical protein